ncbi:DDE-type integrase/transposase/recombinase [Streptobacillus felis]|uniref:DDE-type integrase/transposase/recombinase n=1 Tax=Streptobacillus felis TaxID=1384509 RepID=A0A7Z0PGH6_9FUSO|nr:DDE-type integrase/transposase/recombinase [Streptobacillus felis]NYV28127.1 DDE-type integrase/transposase/recombinase [Streptobacillus felis]
MKNTKFEEFKKFRKAGFKIIECCNNLNISYSTGKRYNNMIENGIEAIDKKDIKRSTKLTIVQEEFIVNLYLNECSYFNFKHFYEYILLNKFEANISYKTLLRIFHKHKILSPKSRKNTIRLYKKLATPEQIQGEKNLRKIDEILFKNKYFKPKNNIFPKKPKIKYFGERVEADASLHPWILGNTRITLHIFVDCAYDVIVGAYFDNEESLFGYYKSMEMMLINYGIPVNLVTDNRAVFSNNRKDYETAHINFKKSCNILGIDFYTTSKPQSKGTVERMFQTLQSNLYAELRYNEITSVEEANVYLQEFLARFNSKKLSQLDNTLNKYVSQERENLKFILVR